MTHLFELITPQTAAAMVAIYGLLIVSHLYVLVQKWRFPHRDYSDIGQRMKGWWLIFLVVTVGFIFNLTVLIIFWAFVSLLALREFFSVIHSRPEDRRVKWWLYGSIVVQYYLIYSNSFAMFLSFIPVFVYLLFPIRMLLVQKSEDFLNAMGTLFWGTMMAVYSISYTAYLSVYARSHNLAAGELGLILFLLFVTQFNDATQYIWGKMLGRTKVIPGISPNKTVEGLLGGIVSSILFSILIAPYLTPLSTGYAVLAALLISVAGFFGDITMSAIKRDLHIKDFSHLLPGHGGLLDRIDSLTLTAPLFFHFIRYYLLYTTN